MLTPALMGLAASVLALSTVLAGRPAYADGSPDCSGDIYAKKCYQDGTQTVALPPGARFEGRSGHARPVCASIKNFPDVVVPCVSDEGVWIQSDQCYAKAVDPQPGRSDPAWQGHVDGVLYRCAWQGAPFVMPRLIWFGAPPTPAVDPEELVLRGIREMDLRAVTIGIVPKPGAGNRGLVGLPVWMWVADPGPQTVGPQERTLTVGGMTATMRAHVDRTEWAMGNGDVVTCHGAGTPYRDSYGAERSPTCGYTYVHPGEAYAITATSHWVVDWTGSNGDAGQIRFALVASTSITIGESQALT